MQPGPYTQPDISHSLSDMFFRSTQFHAFNRLVTNLNFPAKIDNNYTYTRKQLLNLRINASVSRNLILTLKDLGILKTRRVRSGKLVKSKSYSISTICGRREFLNNCARPKLAYYENVNKPNETTCFNPHNLTYIECIERNTTLSQSAVGNDKNIRFCTWNAQSICNKTAVFQEYICNSNIDIIALTETWLNENDASVRAECTPVGYKMMDNPRTTRRGGGTALIYRSGLSVINVTDTGKKSSFEYA